MSEELMKQGVLVRGFGGFYVAADDAGTEYILRCKKKFRRMRMSPLVGDEVRFIPGEGEEHGWLEEILPRRTESLRPPVANVSLLLVVICPSPEPDLLLVDRLLVRARMQGMKTAIVVNKCDMGEALADDIRRQYAGADCPVLEVSARQARGLDALSAIMLGESCCCLTGQSGVGKSTLLNALLGLELETGDISEKIQRGKNTTRHAQLLIRKCPEGDIRVLDTAGFSLLELDAGMAPEQLRAYYPEFVAYEGSCRFTPCLHDREPGCQVSAAVARGEINEGRVARYRQLLSDVRESWKQRYH
ncbi:MAG: ribosome small subunit-dependent GTPase A [Clostridiales bacterium]|nr:ribosome small subunit-dependent GTPase A [Clostridiales bacterium]